MADIGPKGAPGVGRASEVPHHTVMVITVEAHFPIGSLASSGLGLPTIKLIPGHTPKASLSEIVADKKLGNKLPAPLKGGVHTEKSDELTFISEGLQPIATMVVAKIEKGEYVDFTELLPKKLVWMTPPYPN